MNKVKFYTGQRVICTNCTKPEKICIKYINFSEQRYYMFPDSSGCEGFIPFSRQSEFKLC